MKEVDEVVIRSGIMKQIIGKVLGNLLRSKLKAGEVSVSVNELAAKNVGNAAQVHLDIDIYANDIQELLNKLLKL